MSGAPAPAQPNNPAASVSPTMPSSLEDVFFASSMQLNDQGNGVYTASVPLSWTNGIGAAHGGWALGLNLNAVLKEVSKKSPHLSHPMSSTSQYLAPAHPRDGGVKITVTVLRRGKRFAFAESRTENGKGELAILATFCIGEAVKAPGVPASIADHGPQLSIESMRYPEMIPPNECEVGIHVLTFI